MSDDTQWMKRALELAERGRGHVEPNPLVGAVIVRDGQLVGEGWHERYGQGHAEINALKHAGTAAPGATLYVTLEPCCHHGKTPPCTDAIIAAGLRRVVAALKDPFPQVSGQGLSMLQAAGLDVGLGLLASEAYRQNAPYFKLLSHKRPYVHAKWAMTLDGKIATRTGDSKWISNEASRRRVHELRGRMDAIIIGIGTALADDPLLTARPPGPRTATRIVLDSQGRLPLSSQLVQTARQIPTMVVGQTSHPSLAPLTAAGCEILTLPGTTRPDVLTLLDELGRRHMTNVLVEGGAEMLGSFFDADVVDEVHVFIAPRIAGGRDGRTAIAGVGVDRMATAMRLDERQVEVIDGDFYFHGRK
jgi:diaminohydroxyphosphoribosylaminopyrimidine deaminase/5-amino-6-(5-phosphoribosylamino)uracil reductase